MSLWIRPGPLARLNCPYHRSPLDEPHRSTSSAKTKDATQTPPNWTLCMTWMHLETLCINITNRICDKAWTTALANHSRFSYFQLGTWKWNEIGISWLHSTLHQMEMSCVMKHTSSQNGSRNMTATLFTLWTCAQFSDHNQMYMGFGMRYNGTFT